MDVGGDFGELNTEVIISQNPDLIFASELTTPEQVQALEELGLTVYVLPNPVNFEDLEANLQTVGILTGRVEEAEELIQTQNKRISAIDETISEVQQRPKIFYEIDATDPLAPWTAGNNTFINTLITRAGGENLGNQYEGEWIQINTEELIIKNPDIIILGDYTWGGITPEDVISRTGWETISAIQNDKLYTFDDNLVSRPGPRLVDGLEQMAQLIHPELFSGQPYP